MKNLYQGDIGVSSSGRSAEIVVSTVGCIGADNFATEALERINTLLDLGAWAVYRLRADAPPEFSFGATRGRPDITAACWEQYRAGLYRTDHSFERTQETQRGCVSLSRLNPHRLAPAHRAAIYDRYSIQERLSVVSEECSGSLLTLNFYRFGGQRWFSQEDEADLLSAAAVLVVAVQRHLALVPAVSPSTHSTSTHELEKSVLLERCPRLTERELEVCVCLVRGWSFDGIAARLNVSATTVKTYRDRAFRRLGISHRNQLYGVCVTGVVQKTSQQGSTHA